MVRFRTLKRPRLLSGTAALVVCALCVSLPLAGCGSSKRNSSSAAVVANTQSSVSDTSTTSGAVAAQSTTTSPHRQHTHAATKKATSGHTSTTHTTSTHASNPTTTSTTHTSTTTHATTTSSHSTPAVPTVTPLPSPKISGSSGGLRAWLHAANHTPTAGKRWKYEVLAADSSSHPLSGTVDTEFAFNGTVVGRETPPTHPLKNGVLHDGVTFPSRAEGIPLTFRIVVHTRAGVVTLDWAVKVHK